MLHDQDEAAGGPTPAGKSWHYTNEFARLIFIPYTQETRHMIHQPTTHKKLFLAYFAQLLFLLPLLLCRRYKEKWSPCYSTLCHGISKRKRNIICFLRNWVLQSVARFRKQRVFEACIKYHAEAVYALCIMASDAESKLQATTNGFLKSSYIQQEYREHFFFLSS